MAETNGNGNGYVKKWHFLLSIIGMAVAIATFLFRAGAVDATIDGRLMRTETDIIELQQDYARKDVVEQRLRNMEDSEKRIESEEVGQEDTLNKILLEQRRR